ncbi:MAG: spermidine/putrescine ABC transporter substrate-binding protein [Actinomycetes bacterium]
MNSHSPDDLNILAPIEMKPKMDYLHREVQRAAGSAMSRRKALSLGGLALFAAACGSTSTSTTPTGGASSGPASASPSSSLAGKPIENMLEIFNWSEYDDPSTYKLFAELGPVAAAGTKTHETYYSSNDELLAKLNSGGSTYDLIVPSQNAVAQLIQEGKLMALDQTLLPNLKYLEPSFLKSSYDPTGEFSVIKDFGVTLFYFNNKIVTDDLKTMHDFYMALPKYVSKGRTNLLDGAEELVPLGLMALGLDPNTTSQADFDQVRTFLLSIRSGVTTISADYIQDAIAGKIILGQGWNGDVRRIVQGRKAQGDITAVLPTGSSEVWSDNWCIPLTAPHPVAAHTWINWLLTPTTAVTEMEYHSYPIPIPDALSQLPADMKNDQLFNVPTSYTDGYHYILNVSPQVVQQRTKIYTEFKAS